MTLEYFLTGFLIATVKFVFAANIVFGVTKGEVGFLWVVLSTMLGALASFNLFFLGASYFMQKAKEKKLKKIKAGKISKKKSFSKRNKFLVNLKKSKTGYPLLIILGPVFLSVPLGSIIVAKFFGDRKGTYMWVTLNLICWSFLLAGIGKLWA